jgi:16S rRNA (guanine527-N7)-methyltransferase
LKKSKNFNPKALLLLKIFPMEEILKYFPDINDEQRAQFEKLGELYQDWNAKINVISRKDIESLYVKHVLHSLAIAKVQPFTAGTTILDVGTGGGFPGVPLAILFPETRFYLIDVILKKITVVKAVADGLGLKNVKAEQLRAENVKGDFDFIVSRAVTNMPDFVSWVKDKIKKQQKHELKNGILYLKGGDLSEELKDFPNAKEFNIADFFDDPFFETKKVVHLPLKFKA